MKVDEVCGKVFLKEQGKMEQKKNAAMPENTGIAAF